MVSRLLFAPFGMLGGLIAGLLGRQIFKAAWSLIDEQEPPQPQDSAATWPKVVLALLLQGAIFRASRGVVDHALRKAFSALTGFWPGRQRPKAAAS